MGADGRVVWDMSWAFLDADCPGTANPSLWRQAQLTAKDGLYEVSDGIYQVRGWHLTDEDQRYRMELSNGALVHHPTDASAPADVSITLTRPQLVQLLTTGAADGAAIDGDASVLGKLIGLLDEPDPIFAVVTP
jgi:alkyl sulfatase BDS1-like metallo-beta-lactamase superfamily hydrolase